MTSEYFFYSNIKSLPWFPKIRQINKSSVFYVAHRHSGAIYIFYRDISGWTCGFDAEKQNPNILIIISIFESNMATIVNCGDLHNRRISVHSKSCLLSCISSAFQNRNMQIYILKELMHISCK